MRRSNFDRGYQWVDVRAGAKSFRFVNTHLEAFSSDLALAQASEMLAEATAAGPQHGHRLRLQLRPAEQLASSRIDHVPHKAPYELITGRRRLHRRVARVGSGQPGLDVGPLGARERRDGGQVRPPHRHDLRAGRPSGDGLAVDRGEVTGDHGRDEATPTTGLWPSDHGGVVLRLRGL